MRAELVDRLRPRHAEHDDDGAAVGLDQPLRLDGQVLEPWHRAADEVERAAAVGLGRQRLHHDPAHVHTGEHGVDDADPLHGLILMHSIVSFVFACFVCFV